VAPSSDVHTPLSCVRAAQRAAASVDNAIAVTNPNPAAAKDKRLPRYPVVVISSSSFAFYNL
jgi:hypothetical protein